MAKCYQMVGVPGSGKSTWIANQEWAKDCVVVSTDKFVEDYARTIGSTYADVFEEYMPTAIQLMAEEVVRAREAGLDIIWDQTSTTAKSRLRKFSMLPKYDHIAVVFQTPQVEQLMYRLAGRPEKKVPWEVVDGMIKNFEMPDSEEGFLEIWHV